MSPDNPCHACGACCDHPEPWSTIDLDAADVASIPVEMTVHSWGQRVKMARNGNRCVALIGTVGIDARCSIYEIRPTICRSYDPAVRAQECNMCRAPHNLPPLTSAAPQPAVCMPTAEPLHSSCTRPANRPRVLIPPSPSQPVKER